MTHAEWYNLPLNVREIFYNIASKASEGNAMDWLNHLVPAHLHNNPADIKDLMGLKDVSRIISGEHGGEYTYENTILEDRSVNRSRGDGPDGKHADMTEQELAEARLDLKSDAELIDSGTPSDVDTSVTADAHAEGEAFRAYEASSPNTDTVSYYLTPEEMEAAGMPIQEVEVTVFGDPETTTMTFDPSEVTTDLPTSVDSDTITQQQDFFAKFVSEADSAVEATETASYAASATSATATAVETGTEAFDFFAATGEVIGQVATPVVLAMKAGRAFSKDPDEQAGAAVCVGTIASVGMFTPAAPLIGIGALGWTLWGLGEGFINWLNNDPKGTPVKW